ncbi:1-phosphofructokinase [Bacillus ginsengihumi]|uniref:Tagatose-6-phosphate kinase n=1 Tax=Heyndrickxia ginsengihumi TaxID=363870 RepID=A0A6M0P6Q0_9BACI|nr:1-phosphofructokinase [Heyndrickxia ginsengihumi]MBE6184396.1 1-phosphofructokinase [Bacillus sp. (in: firmicutes)]MCM3023117.1 1-phosphofructokinase [Heyndrickxia ginsengihumi]NEY19955.1 1-phosphofructokinase [Heyndrickxia ginsengihumi]
MIYTCTLNPAIDLFVELENFQPYVVNRSITEDYQANGKAINISFILKKMGIGNTAMGFLGGFTGQFIEEVLQKKGIHTDFVRIEGTTRINTFVRSRDKEYKIVNRGPNITRIEETLMIEKINQLTAGDILFVSGSLPRGVSDDILIEISRIAREKQLRLILDVSSTKLLDCLAYRPYLIKPNEEELSAMFGKRLLTREEVIEAAHQLMERGVQNILVSLGEKGALFVNKDKVIMTTAPKGKVVNTACAGDSMLAAFVGSILLEKSIEESLAFSTAVGSSTAFSMGLSNLLDVPELVKQVQLQELEYKGGN